MGHLTDAAVEEVVRAWLVAGPAPHLHQREKERLGAHWPVLARAVDHLATARQADRARAQVDDELRDNPLAATVAKIAPAVRLDRPKDTTP